MKKKSSWLITIPIFLICLLCSCDRHDQVSERSQAGIVPGDTIQLAVMATADVHGWVRSWDYYRDRESPGYGLSKIATLVDSIRREYPHNLLLDAGDWLQGNPFAEYFALQAAEEEHYPFLTVADHMDFDAIVLGNHEFNFGLDYLNRQIEMTKTPVIGANIYHHRTNDPAYPPYITKDVAGFRIAVIGLTTPGSAVWDRSRVEGELMFGDGVEAAERFVRKVKDDEDADVVIILAHSGLDGDTSYEREDLGRENFGRQVGEQVEGVDLLVLGHTHRTIESMTLDGPDGRTVGVIQPGRWASHLGIAFLELTHNEDGDVQIVDQSSVNQPVDDVPEHSEIVALTEEPHQRVVDFVTEPLVRTDEEWSAELARMQDTPIIDLIQHVQKDVTGAQLSAAAAFNTSVTLGPGEITRGDIALLYPYFNTLYKLEITGKQLREFLEHTSQYYLTGTDDKGMPVVNQDWPGFNFDMLSGVEYVLDSRRTVGDRVTVLEYDNEPVDDDDTFTIAINSYRAEGGGGFDMLSDVPVIQEIDRSVGDMIIEYLKNEEKITYDDVFEKNWRLVY